MGLPNIHVFRRWGGVRAGGMGLSNIHVFQTSRIFNFLWVSTGTWQSDMVYSKKLLNIIDLMKCEDHHTKKPIKENLPYNCLY